MHKQACDAARVPAGSNKAWLSLQPRKHGKGLMATTTVLKALSGQQRRRRRWRQRRSAVQHTAVGLQHAATSCSAHPLALEMSLQMLAGVWVWNVYLLPYTPAARAAASASTTPSPPAADPAAGAAASDSVTSAGAADDSATPQLRTPSHALLCPPPLPLPPAQLRPLSPQLRTPSPARPPPPPLVPPPPPPRWLRRVRPTSRPCMQRCRQSSKDPQS